MFFYVNSFSVLVIRRNWSYNSDADVKVESLVSAEKRKLLNDPKVLTGRKKTKQDSKAAKQKSNEGSKMYVDRGTYRSEKAPKKKTKETSVEGRTAAKVYEINTMLK